MYKNKTLLIVDDSPFERKILRDAVIGLEFNILEAEDGEVGVKIALEKIPDLILMDVQMKGINGYQATKQLMSDIRLKNTVIIMCTSKNKDDDIRWAEKQGAKAYIIKPVDKEQLLTQIYKLLPQ